MKNRFVSAVAQAVARFVDSPRFAVLASVFIPTIVVTYSAWSTGVVCNVLGLFDHLALIGAFILFYGLIMQVRIYVLRVAGSFLFVFLLSLFFLFTTLHHRFFNVWGQIDAMRQWDDLIAIWSGILALTRPADLFFLLFLPLLAWLGTQGYTWISRGNFGRNLFVAVAVLLASHSALASKNGDYSESDPLFYVIRSKLKQYQIERGAQVVLSGRTGDVSNRLPINKDIYASGGDTEYPLAKVPLPPKPLPDALTHQPNVVLVLMESLRAYEVGAYGAKVSMTPNLDRLAREGVRVTDYYATAAQTIRSECSIHMSYPPNMGGYLIYRSKADLAVKTLPMVLKERGYQTMWIGGHAPTFDQKIKFLSKHGIDAFHFDPGPKSLQLGWGASDEDIFRYAADIFSRQKGPFFAEIMTLSNHFPFDAPYPTKGQTPKVDGDSLYQGYMDGIHYADHAIGRFIERVSQMPFAKNTVFVFIADHGVWLFPNELTAADMVAKQEIYFRVPCIFWSPSLIKPRVLNKVASHVDIAPSILDLINVHVKNSFVGTSFFRDDVDRRMALMIQDNRWNMRTGNEYLYDVGPESFLSHYPSRELNLWNFLKVHYEVTPHASFRTDADILRDPLHFPRTPMDKDKSKELSSFAENTMAFVEALIHGDRIVSKEDGLTATSAQAAQLIARDSGSDQ